MPLQPLAFDADVPLPPVEPRNACVEPKLVTVSHKGHELAATSCALKFEAPELAAAAYLPRADVHMELLTRSGRTMECPVRGLVAFWNVAVGGETIEDAAFSVEDATETGRRLEGRIAFDRDKISTISCAPRS